MGQHKSSEMYDKILLIAKNNINAETQNLISNPSAIKSMIRQPICVFMGHVDHGKTTVLDTIRHTAVAKSEAGAITQMISSSSISIDTIKRVCGSLIKRSFQDYNSRLASHRHSGHAAFTNLRKRGGNLADIAVLVIDINEGIMPQTTECIEILKQYKTPFVIALNKLDLLQGWREKKGICLM